MNDVVPRSLRVALREQRETLRELKGMGISRVELWRAVRAARDDGDLPRGQDYDYSAAIIVAELTARLSLPQSFNWDKLFELIEKLMPLIEMWLAAC